MTARASFRRWAWPQAFVAGVGMMLLSGCYQPAVPSGSFSCSASDTRCPEGMQCDVCAFLCVAQPKAGCEVGSRDLAAPPADLYGSDGPAPSADLAMADMAVADMAIPPDLLAPADMVVPPDMALPVCLNNCPGGAVCSKVPGCVPTECTDEPDEAFVDTDCDGIDGSITKAIFIDPVNGNDAANHGLLPSLPKKSLHDVEVIANAQGRRLVLVASGTTTETGQIRLPNGIRVYGGYDAKWVRSAKNPHAVVRAPGVATVIAMVGGPARMVWDRVDIQASTPAMAGASSIALHAANVDNLAVSNAIIAAAPGSPGNSGNAVQPGSAGGKGTDGQSQACGCKPDVNACSFQCPQNLTAGKGGTSDCNARGGDGSTTTAGIKGDGAGGGDGATPGGQAQRGRDGAAGAGGGGGKTSVFQQSGYVSGDAGDGAAGSSGGGGGGGILTNFSMCDANCMGPAAVVPGSGGGAGGCGGPGGKGGKGGGASIARYLWASKVTFGPMVTLSSNAGGNGGNGNNGAAGGVGASGGQANNVAPSSAGANGGTGGTGGGGGAGSGGPSICIVSGKNSQVGQGYTCQVGQPGQPGQPGQGGNGGNQGLQAAQAFASQVFTP